MVIFHGLTRRKRNVEFCLAARSQPIIITLCVIRQICFVRSDDNYWYYKDLQKEVEKSAKETEELLEVFGEKFKYHGVSTNKYLFWEMWTCFEKFQFFIFTLGFTFLSLLNLDRPKNVIWFSWTNQTQSETKTDINAPYLKAFPTFTLSAAETWIYKFWLAYLIALTFLLWLVKYVFNNIFWLNG